ncbi:P2X purinoceptor 3a [Colossoma macropomum]|uniref:P2X purinoceptor 3a n=1 Tax=Colossoma macropomum TaxID=42526 RepID=UPI0018640072|nr:P2X purinoceptor 3a [Colossoma macropomum]
MLDCASSFFTYETTKSVVVKRRSLGIINRIVQALIIIYFVGYVFLYEKAYQDRDTGIESAVMTKVKGFGFYDNYLMDVADYVTPPQGASVFCIITRMVITRNQTHGRCHEADKKFNCSTDKDCEKHLSSNLASGKITGKCVTEAQRCEIEGWCPAEDDTKKMPPMKEAENFTIFIKNSIRFPRFNVTRGNIRPKMENKNTCLHHPVHDTSCPIFRVGDVLKYAGVEFSNIASTGGEIGINIGWVCNLDLGEKKCLPKYSFTQLDSAFKHNSFSKGFNFRFAKYYMSEDGREYRTLHKAFAIRFDILVSGNAGKFYIVPTLINIVAACTSVGLATIFCDIILLNFLKGSEQYKAKKFEEVSGSVSWSESHELHMGSQMLKEEVKNSDDSGAYSIGYSAGQSTCA